MNFLFLFYFLVIFSNFALISILYLCCRYLREFQPLGTGGGLYHFRDQILRGNPNVIFVLHHDVCCNFPLDSMLKHHQSKNMPLITIMATRIADRSKARNYGCLVAAAHSLNHSKDIDTLEIKDKNATITTSFHHSHSRSHFDSLEKEIANKSGIIDGNDNSKINDDCCHCQYQSDRLLHYVEKPETFISDLINCGVYCLDRQVFQEMDSILREKNSNVNNHLDSMNMLSSSSLLLEDVVSLEQDIIMNLVEQGKSIYVFRIQENWCQIKTTNSIIEANRVYLDHYHQLDQLKSSISTLQPSISSLSLSFTINGNVFIDPTSTIGEQSKIGPNVSIGFGCLIGKGVRIKDSIILNGTTIGDNSIIKNAVIGWDSRIGKWNRIEGTPIDNIVTILGSDVIVDDERIIRNCVVLPNKEIRSNYHGEIIL